MTMENFYYCPVCRGKLASRRSDYLCHECKKEFPVENGVPDFRETDTYWGIIDRKVMRQILEYARTKGWQEALEVILGKERPSYCEYIMDSSRSYWNLLMPLAKESTVLDIGCGWGSLSFPLSKQYKTLFALDSTKEKVQLINLRCQQSGTKNIIPVCADALKLPFADDYFDLIVVYGVLEWMGLADEQEKPEFSQSKSLREIHRVLKKDGLLFLSIENRWAITNIMGFRDPHTNLRFVTLLPRVLADVYSGIARGQPYRAYTHSLRTYKGMFTEAGFSEIDTYSPLPSYRNFWYVLPLENRNVMKYFLDHLASSVTPLSTHLLNIARLSRLYNLIKYVVPDYSFVVKK